MSSVSKMVYESNGGYLGNSKYLCHCNQPADLWKSGTEANPGRIFIKCGMVKVSVSEKSAIYTELYSTFNPEKIFFSFIYRNASFGNGKTSYPVQHLSNQRASMEQKVDV
jgi:hypothetical protein